MYYYHIDGPEARDCLDVLDLFGYTEIIYDSVCLDHCYNCRNCYYSSGLTDCSFCYDCKGCSSCFMCVNLREKKYCILNKQYTKEEYEELVPRIIAHMVATGEWGKYLPMSLSPFGYNETVAQEYLPLTREEALARGYKWKDVDAREYAAQRAVPADRIKEVTDAILNETLACKKCGKNYRIIAQELRRLRQFNVPVPDMCPDCRHVERMKLRNPFRLWERACAKCGATMQTTFAPDRKETVYCEKCYTEEVF